MKKRNLTIEFDFLSGMEIKPESARLAKAAIIDLIIQSGPKQPHEVEDQLFGGGSLYGLMNEMVTEGILVEAFPVFPNHKTLHGMEELCHTTAYGITPDTKVRDLFRYHRKPEKNSAEPTEDERRAATDEKFSQYVRKQFERKML